MLLEQITQTNDIKQIAPDDYGILAEEIRKFLIQSISVTGGHLGSNLGAVELTMALHLFLNLPEDKLIWDVGHQSYTHKILTGRRDGFVNLRKFVPRNDFGYTVTLVLVCLDYFYTDIVRKILAGTDRYAAASHDDDFLYFGVPLARMQPDILDMAFGRCKENDISRLYTIHTAGDNGLVLPFNGYNMIKLLFVQQFGQLFVYESGVITYFHAYQD